MTYYTVRMDVYAFDTKEEADKYREALEDAFMAMPESAALAASTDIIEDLEEGE